MLSRILQIKLCYPGLLRLCSAATLLSLTAVAAQAEGLATVNKETSEQAEAEQAAAEQHAAEQAALHAAEQAALKEWRKPARASREIVPPPPPGPYMSAALTGPSVNPPAFARHRYDSDAAQQGRRPAEPDMRMFSPDRPWPEDLRGHKGKPQRWMPEDGYKFVSPSEVKKPLRRPYYSSPWPYYQQGYTYMPAPPPSASYMPAPMRPASPPRVKHRQNHGTNTGR